MQSHPFVAFIKGTPEAPKCKFTRKLVGLFAQSQYRYKTCDVLADERMRNWVKIYSNWPTFPQVFIAGKLVGGVDIVADLVESGEFDAMVPASCKCTSALDEWQQVLSGNKVVALIEGEA